MYIYIYIYIYIYMYSMTLHYQHCKSASLFQVYTNRLA